MGMIKWPGKIAPRASNQMVSVHDISRRSPASSARRCPTNRPIDGVDQGAFLLGKQARSNRESLITFIGEDIAAVRWRQIRVYPKQFVSSLGNPSMYGLAASERRAPAFPPSSTSRPTRARR